MKRGGKRTGAGRPPGSIGNRKLTAEERICIGAAVEKRLYEADLQTFDAAVEKLPRREEIKQLYQEVKDVPVEDRRVWLRSQRRRDYIDDINATMRLARKEAGLSGAGRVWEITQHRSQGGKQKIYEEIAAEWTKKLGGAKVSQFEVTPRMVRSCFEELKRRLDESDDD